MTFITLAPDMTLAYLLTQRLMDHVKTESHEVWDEIEHECIYPEHPTDLATVCIHYWNRTRHCPLTVTYFWIPARTTPDMEHCREHTIITLYDEWSDLHYGSYIQSYSKQA